MPNPGEGVGFRVGLPSEPLREPWTAAREEGTGKPGAGSPRWPWGGTLKGILDFLP